MEKDYKKYRVAVGLRQCNIAEQLGIKKPYLCTVEKGHRGEIFRTIKPKLEALLVNEAKERINEHNQKIVELESIIKEIEVDDAE